MGKSVKKEGMRKFLGSGIACLLLLLALGAAPSERAWAASAVVTLSTGSDEVLEGEIFSLVVTLESSEEIGNVEMFIVFDPSKVSFQSEGKYSIGGDGLVLISDWDESAGSVRKKYSMEFQAKSAGECRFSIGDQPAVYLSDGEEQVSISSVSLDMEILKEERQEEEDDGRQEISVTGEATSDKRAQLKSLTPSAGVLEPAFDKGITSYQLTVPNGVDSLSLAAVAQDEEAAISIKGNEGLQVGENQVTVTVKAPNGAKKKYAIQVIREEAAAFEEEEDTGKGLADGVHCSEEDSGMLLEQYLQIRLEQPEEELIPEGYMETSIRLDGYSIAAYMPEDNMESETYLIYGADREGEARFYEYSRIEHTLRPYAPSRREASSSQAPLSTGNASFPALAAIVALSVACAGLSAALALQIWKQKRKKEREEEDDFFKDFL